MTSIEERYQWRARDNVRIHAILSDEIALRPFLENASHEAANKIIRAIGFNFFSIPTFIFAIYLNFLFLH